MSAAPEAFTAAASVPPIDAHLEAQREQLFRAITIVHVARGHLDGDEPLTDDDRHYLERALRLVEEMLDGVAGALEPILVARAVRS